MGRQVATLAVTACVAGAVMMASSPASAQIPTREVRAEITHAPAVPPPVNRRRAAKVIVELEAQELEGELIPGVRYQFWTFGGRVPGNFIRVREGDLVEIHLTNRPDSRNPHNIDLHAVSGSGGGASASLVAPGESSVFAFQALNPGLYVYHCATAPVGMHVANGMYGLILVEPREGLRPVDREYYVMQSEFYTDGEFGETGFRQFSMEEALREAPDYIVFNGAVGALTGERSLTAEVGETVRLYVGNAGPNLLSSFHVIGEIFDRTYADGATTPVENLQTVRIPPGGAAIVEFGIDAPGSYVLVDHAIFRAFNKGALAYLQATGPEDRRVFSGRIADDVYHLEGAAVQSMPESPDSAAEPLTVAQRIERGRQVYMRTCRACHQEDGKGVPGSFPPLAGSDFLNADPRMAVKIVLNGFQGPIVVNGQLYNAVMPALRLTDEEIADVLTYVYNQWDNNGTVITTDLVREIRVCPWCDEQGVIPQRR